MSIHIAASKADISNIVLMPGDPKRCEFIALNYLNDYKIVNSIRGMTGYTGFYKGKKISVIPSGMGIPSMGIYVHELYTEYDVDTIIRVGTCGTYNNKLLDIIIANEVITTSTFAYEYNKNKQDTAYPAMDINDILKKHAYEKNINIKDGSIFTTDSFYKTDSHHELLFDGVEMETFALFHIAASLNKKAASVLTVSDIIDTDQQISSDDREKGLNKMIELVLESTLLM